MILQKDTKIFFFLNAILSSFLLFTLELIFSKLLLFNFGGVYTVWAGAIVFFQIILLIGYIFSYQIIYFLKYIKIRYLFLFLLLLSLFFLPNTEILSINIFNQAPFIFKLFILLLLSVGLVSFILSTSTIILHKLLSANKLNQNKSIISLYGFSNIGAFLGLFLYVFVLEYYFDVQSLLHYWKVCYIIFILIQICLIYRFSSKSSQEISDQTNEVISKKTKLIWIFYSAAAVILYLSITNVITYDILPIPLLWILPLSIYLASFVFIFKKNPWYPNIIKNNIHTIFSLYLIYYFIINKNVNIPIIFKLIFIIPIFILLLIVIQNSLIDHRPNSIKNVPIFYTLIALGGAIGGIIISWIVPIVFNSSVEILFPILILCITPLLTKLNNKPKIINVILSFTPLFLFLFVPAFFKINRLFFVLVIFYILPKVYFRLKTEHIYILISIILLMIFEKQIDLNWLNRQSITRYRNYYGIYSITRQNGLKYLFNGNTIHGAQNLNQKKQSIPLTYYHVNAPIGKILSSDKFDFKNVAFVGLGAGSLASYQKQSQSFDFIDIDPDVFKIALNDFNYLNQNSFKKRFFIDDGRKAISSSKSNYYDLIVLDAFSGDSVPIHLLTTEAIKTYLNHLTEKGLIIFHISNNFLDLKRVLYKNAKSINSYSCYNYNITSKNESTYGFFSSRWFAITKNKDTYSLLESTVGCKNIKILDNGVTRPWTDQYSSPLSIFKLFNNNIE